jgi:Protein of unknown function (DUF3037)
MPHTVVIQYVPDTVTNERVNIGVSILSDGKAVTHFLTDWARVRQFADRDIQFLKDLKHESRHWDEKTVRRLSHQWTGSIQFSQPRFTLLAPDEALIDGLQRYLFERTVQTRGYRDKASVVKATRQQIRAKLESIWGSVGVALLKTKTPKLLGEASPYQFDITVANGEPYFAAHGISFEAPENKHLDKEVWSTSWLLQAVKEQTPEFPVAIVVAPPQPKNDSTEMFKRAVDRFQDLGAKVLEENEVADWATTQSKQLVSFLKRGG